MEGFCASGFSSQMPLQPNMTASPLASSSPPSCSLIRLPASSSPPSHVDRHHAQKMPLHAIGGFSSPTLASPAQHDAATQATFDATPTPLAGPSSPLSVLSDTLLICSSTGGADRRQQHRRMGLEADVQSSPLMKRGDLRELFPFSSLEGQHQDKGDVVPCGKRSSDKHVGLHQGQSHAEESLPGMTMTAGKAKLLWPAVPAVARDRKRSNSNPKENERQGGSVFGFGGVAAMSTSLQRSAPLPLAERRHLSENVPEASNLATPNLQFNRGSKARSTDLGGLLDLKTPGSGALLHRNRKRAHQECETDEETGLESLESLRCEGLEDEGRALHSGTLSSAPVHAASLDGVDADVGPEIGLTVVTLPERDDTTYDGSRRRHARARDWLAVNAASLRGSRRSRGGFDTTSCRACPSASVKRADARTDTTTEPAPQDSRWDTAFEAILAVERTTTRAHSDERRPRSFLETFASRPAVDSHMIVSNPNHPNPRRRDWTPAYAAAYSNASRRGGNAASQILALGTESGAVKVIDTRAHGPDGEWADAPGCLV